jgi:hypothetical protein
LDCQRPALDVAGKESEMSNDLQVQNAPSDSMVRDAVARTLAVVGLSGVALIHVLDAHDTFLASPWKGWLYVGLIAGCVGAGAVLVRRSDRRAWLATLLLPLGALSAFVYSRTVGLPGGADDIGNWWEPLGLSSLFVEGALITLAANVLVERAAPARAVPRRRPDLQRSLS